MLHVQKTGLTYLMHRNEPVIAESAGAEHNVAEQPQQEADRSNVHFPEKAQSASSCGITRFVIRFRWVFPGLSDG